MSNNDPNFSTVPVVVPANGVTKLDMKGNFIINLTSSTVADSLLLTIGTSRETRFDAYDNYTIDGGLVFEQLTIRNTTGADINCKVGVAIGKIGIANAVTVSGTVTTQESQFTAATANADVALVNGVATLIAAASATPRIVEATNNVANAVPVRYGSNAAAAAAGAELGVGAQLKWDCKAALYMFVAANGKSISSTTRS